MELVAIALFKFSIASSVPLFSSGVHVIASNILFICSCSHIVGYVLVSVGLYPSTTSTAATKHNNGSKTTATTSSTTATTTTESYDKKMRRES